MARKEELLERKHRLREQRLNLMKQEKDLELKEKARQIQLGAEWLKLQQAEYDKDQKWKLQQREMEEFENSKRIGGWVHEAAVHVSRGDVASVKSREIPSEKAKSGSGKKLGKQ